MSEKCGRCLALVLKEIWGFPLGIDGEIFAGSSRECEASVGGRFEGTEALIRKHWCSGRQRYQYSNWWGVRVANAL